LIRHLRQKSSDQLTPEHPRSPTLLRKIEPKGDSRYALSSRWESSGRQSTSPRPWTSSLTQLTTQSPTTDSDRERMTGSLERPKKVERYGTSTREDDMSPLSERAGSGLGYTVAQYGGEPPQTVSSRTYTDNGRGTVTSTFTSETRYSAVSPVRTFEYSKGTLSSVADDGRAIMPTTYSETRVQKSPRPSPRAIVETSIARDQEDSKVPTKKPQDVEYTSSSFVTDSRSYGVGPSRVTETSVARDVPITLKGGPIRTDEAPPLRYFGDEVKEEKRVKEEERGGSDVGMITTTYEKFRSPSRENIRNGGRIDSTSSYTSSTFDPAKISTMGLSRPSADLKDSAYTAASYGTSADGRAKPVNEDYDRFPPPPPPPPPLPPPLNEPPITVLERIEELPTEPKNWNEYAEREMREREKRAEAEAYRREREYRSQAEGFDEQEARRQVEKRAERDAYRREQSQARDRWGVSSEKGRKSEKQIERDAYLRDEGRKSESSVRRHLEKEAEEDAYQRGLLRTDWRSREDEREREQRDEKEAYRREMERRREYEKSVEKESYGPEGRVGWEYENSAEAEARRRDQLMRASKSEGYRVEHDEPSFLRTQSEFDAEKDRPPDPRSHYTPERRVIGETPVGTLARDEEIEMLALSEASQRTAEYMRVKEEDDKIFERHGLAESSETDRVMLSSKSSIEVDEPEGNIPTNVVEELTPRTRRKLDAQTLRREEDLDETLETMKGDLPAVQTLEKEEQLPHSQPLTPSEPKDQKGFDFGKSKFTSKHEVVKRGKDVDVKLESLKLSKDDQIRIVVIPPARNNGDRLEIEPKVKKSRHTYEISFKPTEVGTHKVMAYVNGIVHPMSPFPIRVYDASEIIVGEIPPQSAINDTVEFTGE
uniref:Major sperm protein n=1 Tax=Toxocara canis TaxID=6265 RepID=A0A183V7Q6_TOXCA